MTEDTALPASGKAEKGGMNRLLHVLTIVSGVACLALLLVLLISYQLDMATHGIAVASRFHVGFFDGKVWFYSDTLPYHGSIIRMGTEKGMPYPGGYANRRDSDWYWSPEGPGFGWHTWVGERGEIVGKDTGGDFPGVYYRHFEWLHDPPLWTLMVSLWYPITLLAVLPAVWFFRNLRLRPVR